MTETVRALLLVDEDKHAGCHYAYRLYDEVAKVAGVESAYPLIGGTDGAVWIEADDLGAVTKAVRAVQGLAGVRATELLVEAPDAHGARSD